MCRTGSQEKQKRKKEMTNRKNKAFNAYFDPYHNLVILPDFLCFPFFSSPHFSIVYSQDEAGGHKRE